MDAEQFLARVVAPGNYAAVNWKDPARDGMAVRFFPRDKLRDAASFLRWISSKGSDAYFAVASFNEATPDGLDPRGGPKFKGSRVRENAQAMRAFWIDIDVKRESDKKKGTNVYADRREALAWLFTFIAAVGLPRPNLWVNSGYGFHVYWVLEDPLTIAEWQPYADAFKAAMQAHGFKCEAGLTSDAARILRPPETMNQKGGAHAPAPVVVLSKFSAGDYPNQLVLQALQPFVGATPATTVVNAGPSPLAGGTPSTVFARHVQNMATATQANLPVRRHHEFAKVAPRCAQVGQSLAVGGAGDAYQLWYLGFLTLAHYCLDGVTAAHDISSGDPRYSQAAVDTALQRIAAEQARKDRGPPRCTSFDGWRPGVCTGCPHFGKILGPWNLGADDGDLPNGYRRAQGKLQKQVRRGEQEWWEDLLAGDVYGPLLDRRAKGGYSLSFVYEYAGTRFPIRVDEPDMPSEAGALRGYFSPQSLILDRQIAPLFGDFIVAWIQDLRGQRAERAEYIPPFGYATDLAGDHAGLSVGGTLYRPDGSESSAPGADLSIVNGYTPHGALAKWQQAADLVGKDRPELQVLIAASFGAPLMHFTGEKALVISAFSADSGVGKSSALRVGQAVWSAPQFMNSMDDTPNSVNEKIAQTRVMPCNWDEMRVKKDAVAAMVDNVFALTQGKEKSRLSSDAHLRDIRTWETLILICSNAALHDHMSDVAGGTDAGMVRVFEYRIARKPMTYAGAANKIIDYTKHHYGHAGREFAKYIATNYAKVDKLVDEISDRLKVELDFATHNEERFYIAGMAATIAGAAIANKLGLTKFDVAEISTFMKNVVLDRRRERGQLLVSGGAMDVEQILATFVSDHIGFRMITNRFARSGPPGDFKVHLAPTVQSKVEIQVGQQEKIMRINRATFIDWCRRKGYSGIGEIRRNMARVLGAMEQKRTIGQGTIFTGGQMWCIEVPLNTPALESYLYITSAPGASRAAHGAALKGNQPKV